MGTVPPWALVLAGADGRRPRPPTHPVAADDRPRQFCRRPGRPAPLEQTRQRSALLISGDCTVAVVVGAHERFYGPLLAAFPPERLAIQPDDRGTAPAILYGLLRIMTVAPNSPIAVFPSDHHVSNDADFMAHVRSAVGVVSGRPDLVVLLGMPPDSTGDGDAWIEPGDRILGPWSELYRARHFWRQPSAGLAVKLRARGCLWDSFVIVAYPCALLNMVIGAVPALLDTFAPLRMRLGTPWEEGSVRRVYSRLPPMDFARQVLQTCPANLAVLPLPGGAPAALDRPGRSS